MRIYKLFKQNFGMEPYLEDIPDKILRRSLCSFRISTHRLRIERGRYCGEKPEERLCDSCNVVDNEVHFLCECNKYDAMRKKMFDNIIVTDIVQGIDHENTFIKLMSNSDKNITKAIANFVHDCGIT